MKIILFILLASYYCFGQIIIDGRASRPSGYYEDPSKYYVDATNGNDANSGHIDAPLKTFNAGLAKLNGTRGTLYLKSGQIFPNVYIYYYSGSTDHQLDSCTIAYYGSGAKPIVIMDTVAPLRINTQDHLTFNGIKFTVGDTVRKHSFASFNGCDYLTITNCTFDGQHKVNGTFAERPQLVGAYDCQYLTFTYDSVMNSGRQVSASGSYGCHGLYYTGDYANISHNVFYDIHDGSGIKNNLNGPTGTTICNDGTITDNYFYHCGNNSDAAIFLQTGYNININYNKIVQGYRLNSGVTLSWSGADASLYPHKINILNNTFVSTTDSSSTSILLYGYATIDSITIKNNIMISDSNNSYNNRFINQVAGGGTHLFINNNLYYERLARPRWTINGTVYTSFASFQALGHDASGKYADPLFTNRTTGDFTLQSGSPAIDMGVNVGLTQDFLGNPIVGLPDAGCYEKQ